MVRHTTQQYASQEGTCPIVSRFQPSLQFIFYFKMLYVLQGKGKRFTKKKNVSPEWENPALPISMQPCPFDPNLSRALVVDEDSGACRSLANILESSGFSTDTCAQPTELLNSLNGQRYALAFVSFNLSGITALELGHHLMDRHNVENLIFMGNADCSDSLVRAMQIGACDFLRHPIQEQELTMLLERLKERRRLKERIYRAEQRNSLLVQNIPLIIYSIRPDLSLDFINQSVHHFLGYTQDEAMARRNWLGYLIHPDDRRNVRMALRKAFDDGSPFSVECRLIHRKGNIVHGIARSITQLPCDPEKRAHGEDRRVEGIFMDITDRVFLENALVQSAKLKTLGSISAEVAHEIRNPLMSIAGFARRLNKKTPAPELDIILRESARLEELLNRIRDYLKPVNISRQGCSVNNLLSNAAALLAPEMDSKSVGWRFELDHELPLALADPDALTQVIIDLVRHALGNLSDAGDITIQTASSEHNVIVKISYPQMAPVLDTEKLFLPFEEDVDVHGLPLCSRMVKNMDGVLEFNQNNGKRNIATFAVTIPKANDITFIPNKPSNVQGDVVSTKYTEHEETRYCFSSQDGVLTRRLFNDIFARTVRASTKARQSLGVIILDVADLDNYARKMGEAEADNALNRIAETLVDELKGLPCNLLARYKEHQYVAILPDTLQDEAAALGESLRNAVTNLHIQYDSGERTKLLTVHVGVTAFTPAPSTNPDEFLAQARYALQDSKERAQNTIGVGGQSAVIQVRNTAIKASGVLSAVFFISMLTTFPLAAQTTTSSSSAPSSTDDGSAALPHFAHMDTIRGRLAASGTGIAAKRFIEPNAVRRAACLAAEMDARRRLVEIANGLGIDSFTITRDFAPESDSMRADSAGMLGPVAVEKQTMVDDRTCHVTVSAGVPEDMRHLLPTVIEPMEPGTEIRAPMMKRHEQQRRPLVFGSTRVPFPNSIAPARSYRTATHPRSGECSFQVVVEETDLHIVASHPLPNEALAAVHELRSRLKAFILCRPEFCRSLAPLDVPETSHHVIRAMADAARDCNVGPMAAVAGGMAEHVARALMPFSSNVLVENGGDTYLISNRDRTIALLADPGQEASLGVRIPAGEFPVSLCASSATYGHSLSLGRGDLVVARSRSGVFADAAATALCNELKAEADVEKVLEAAQRLARGEGPRLEGVFVQCGQKMGAWGKMELALL
eukprot:TRINITY_DN4265_c0_g2_i1.p1 TRINITY_DN4265_c0_g2~~TRINITY_DN4265_c0_g2_i1.p1  ORF type:complete len:1195 (-),score=277.92 TRINITY_DN4265_c0_g2_i1:44780-48364(-)